LNRLQRYRLILLLVPTLIWVATQIVMSGMGLGGGLGGAAMAAGSAGEYAAGQVVICTATGVHTVNLDPTAPPAHTHHKCPWCAQNAGIGPVGNLVAPLPQPKNIEMSGPWSSQNRLAPRALAVANFQARAPPAPFIA